MNRISKSKSPRGLKRGTIGYSHQSEEGIIVTPSENYCTSCYSTITWFYLCELKFKTLGLLDSNEACLSLRNAFKESMAGQ